MARPVWSFVLADANGASLAELTTATGRTLTFTRNSYSEVTFSLSHEDDAASLLLESLRSTGIPTLRCYRKAPFDTAGVLRFAGYLAPFQEDAEEQATIAAVFRSPFGRLLGEGSDRGRYTADTYTITPNGLTADAGAIASDLLNVANSDGFTGLALGTVEASAQRTREYAYSNVGESIQELTAVLDGFDFEEDFVDGGGSTLANLNIFARLGSDQVAAKFEYGPGTLSNVRSMSRTTQPPINVAIVTGANGLVATQSDPTSIVRYGKWYTLQSASDVTSQALLDARAFALLRPNPVVTVDFTPDFGLENCPQPWDEWWLGDTVHLFANRGALQLDTAARVNGATIVVDDEGFEAVEIPDPQTPEEENALRASLALEVTDG